ncbi:hypothetical protein CAC42_7835 [Sphaceloma murrayae]|uniref:54S ribosomal protein L11, mitochondrial n=1 Tax=Sphaceloma murrayae TaxID=2082308 RepID=A0A2K1QXT5_9PEZI|nr:hypothetical protein CAC42_7835 [Sphaceloma murrayae]
MPPRIPFRPRTLRLVSSNSHFPTCQCRLASLATAPTPSFDASSPIIRHPPSQPPSHKHPTLRKSQLHRQYQSILRSSPLLLIFQHNNLKASEWAAIRSQLAVALEKVDAAQELAHGFSQGTRIQIIHTGVFESALKVVEFWTPPAQSKTHPSDPKVASSIALNHATTHGLSQKAWRDTQKAARTQRHGLEPLMSGPLALVTFPSVSPAHVAAALSILSPGEKFPAPKRKANPEYFEPAVQAGLQKLMLLGARVEGRAMDQDGVKWVGGIEGGLTGLRAQLVGLLSSAGVGLVSALDGAGRSLWLAVEGRRMDMEDKEGGPKEKAAETAEESSNEGAK